MKNATFYSVQSTLLSLYKFMYNSIDYMGAQKKFKGKFG